MKLYGISFHPAVLAGMVQLQHLELQDCTLLAPAADEDAADAGVDMAGFGHLQQLRHLTMGNTTWSKCPSPEQMAVLTASSHPTHLELVEEVEEGWALGQGDGVQHMFPPGKWMPQLQVLIIHRKPSWECIEDIGDWWCITTEDLHNILSACQHLTLLDVYGNLQLGEATSLLLLPPTCKSLSLTGPNDDDAAAVLCQLTQLTSLTWGPYQLTDAGLEELTALTDLEKLIMRSPNGLREQVAPCRCFEGAQDLEFLAREVSRIVRQTLMERKQVWWQQCQHS